LRRPGPRVDADKTPMSDAVTKSYSDLFEFAKQTQYGKSDLDAVRDRLKRGQELGA
jgi:hypothetical protein